MNEFLSVEKIKATLDEMKAGFKKAEGTVETVPVEKFLEQFGQLGALCEAFDIKLHDSLGEVTIFESLISGLRLHGIKVFEMHFPDGDQYEVVMRYRENDTHVRTFAYKI